MRRNFKTTMTGLMLAMACLFSNIVLAQNKEISGQVTSSENGQPLAGVTVTVKGTNTSVATNSQGSYRITVGPNAVALVFTSTGFAPLESGIGGRSTIDVVLTVQVKEQEEVVV